MATTVTRRSAALAFIIATGLLLLSPLSAAIQSTDSRAKGVTYKSKIADAGDRSRSKASIALSPASSYESMPAAQELCPCITKYSAIGTVVAATFLKQKVVEVAKSIVTRPGHDEETLATVDVRVLANALLAGGITGTVAHSTADAGGGNADATAELLDFNLGLTGLINLGIAADLLRSAAHTECTFPDSNTSGESEVLNLRYDLDGPLPLHTWVAINVTGSPNQVVSLPGGIKLYINEQKPLPDAAPETGETNPSITVNALRIVIPNIANVTVASSHTSVTCFCRPTE